MVLAYLFELPNVTQEQYEKSLEIMKLGGRSPEGQIFHVAGPMENGGWRVVDVWESQEALDKFFTEKLLPSFKAVGVNELPKPRIVWKVHNIMRPLATVR